VAFLIESVERLPPLDGIAGEVTVHFPWGSLLAGLIAADPATLARLATLLEPGGELRMLISATARDRYARDRPRASPITERPIRERGPRARRVT